MPALPPPLRSASPREVAERLEAERRGVPFLLYRDGDGVQRILPLGGASASIGRQPSSDVPLTWDAEVSRAHALLERVGEAWTIVDEHLSRNGSFVNGRRITGRRRLADGDLISIGHTLLAFRGAADVAGTTRAARGAAAPELSAAQRRVLAALCGPQDDGPYLRPRSNREIADELFLSVETVKSHLRALFDAFGVRGLPQNRKRAELVRRALESGVIG